MNAEQINTITKGDLKGIDIIQGYYEKLTSQNISDRYAALGFALQLPGICGRIENPIPDDNTEQIKSAQQNDKTTSDDNYKKIRKLYDKKRRPIDNKIYQKWFEDHKMNFEILFEDSSDIKTFAKHVYNLRNAYTHEGIVKTQDSNIILVDGRINAILCTKKYLFMSIDDFCEIVFRVAKNVFERNNTSFSSFQSCGMDVASYIKLLQIVSEKRATFWAAHTQEEQSLSMVYNRVFLDDATKLQEVNEFFIAHPEGKYRIDQFSRKYRLAMPSDNYVIFEKKYDNYQGNMCELNKQQFEQMCAIHAEIQEYNADFLDIIKNFLQNT